jgi:hypothetical protein
MQQPPQSWQGGAAQPYFDPHAQQQQQHMGMQPHGQHPGGMQGYDPMLGPQSSPGQFPLSGQFPPSGQHPLQPQQGYGMQGGQGGYPQPGQMGQPYPMNQAGQAPWMTQPSPPPAGMSGPTKFTPQVIMLVSVGAVCLAIFIIGIVLFVTTKF